MSKNVANRDFFPFSAVGTAYTTTPALRFRIEGRGQVTIEQYCRGREQYSPAVSGRTITSKWQWADTLGGIWTDVAGSARTTVPEGRCLPLSIQLTHPFLQLLAFGNAEGHVMMGVDIKTGLGLYEI